MQKLNEEQVKNWRKVLSLQLGPYAFIMPVEQIEKIHARMQQQVADIVYMYRDKDVELKVKVTEDKSNSEREAYILEVVEVIKQGEGTVETVDEKGRLVTDVFRPGDEFEVEKPREGEGDWELDLEED